MEPQVCRLSHRGNPRTKASHIDTQSLQFPLPDSVKILVHTISDLSVDVYDIHLPKYIFFSSSVGAKDETN